MEAKKKLLFESQVCSRCQGSGKHSYCFTHGDRCFKCNGIGETLTKRGAAAQAYFRQLCSKPAGELKAGDVVKATGFTHGMDSFDYRATVISVESYDTTGWTSNGKPVTGQIEVKTKSEKYGENSRISSPETPIEVFGDRTAAREAALAYQAQLTKTGTPRKARAKV